MKVIVLPYLPQIDRLIGRRENSELIQMLPNLSKALLFLKCFHPLH